MPCKHLISTGLLLLCSTFLACMPSSNKKNQPAPTAPTEPVNPSPTPKPTPSPIPTPTVPEIDVAPAAQMIGDWQSTLSDPNYFGNVTYSIKADGRVLMTLLVYGKGQNQLMAERHEFKGAFDKTQKTVQLEHVKGSCAPKNSKVTISITVSESDPEVMYLVEDMTGPYLRLHKVKGGLNQNVHSVQTLRDYTVDEGCFAEGRLNQFVPNQVRG